MPKNISHLAEDFIMCCLRKNPFNRKNVYKLLQHPFIQSIKSDTLGDDEEKAVGNKILKEENATETMSKTLTGKLKPINKKPNIRLPQKSNHNEVTISNYDKIVSTFDKQGHKDKLILELQRDLDDKTFAIEIRLKANKNSQTESKATPNSESEANGQHFFPQDLSSQTKKEQFNKNTFRLTKN